MIKIIELDSGIKLILDEMDSVKSSCVGIWCKTGSSYEQEKEFGISHFIEHMLFKGTSTRNSYEIVDEMESLGADFNAFTSKEYTCFYAKCIDENIFKAADVLIDMIESPLFDSKELEREKSVVIEEINMNADDPDDVALDTFENLLFKGSSLAHPVLGYKENIESFNRDFLFKYYKEHYCRDNIIVSIAGSFNEQKVVDYFNKRFANLSEKSKNNINKITDSKAEQLTIYKDIEQAHIVSGLRTVPYNDDRRLLLSVISTLFGGGMSSRLFQSIREKRGLAYSVYSNNSFFSFAGEFGIVAGVAKDKVDEYMEAIKNEVNLLATNEINIDEINRAVMQLKSSYTFSLENTMSRMRANGNSYLREGCCHNHEEILHKLDIITKKDIEESKELIYDFSTYTTVIVTGK